MYKIYIDTTKRFENKVQLLQNDEVVDEILGDFDLIDAIKSLLANNLLSAADIADFSVNEGPGSFTGIKIGVTVANILNWLNLGDSVSKKYMPNYGSEPNIFDTPWIEK